MRNYYEIQCLRLYPLPFDPETFYVVFGGDDDSLLYYSNRLQALVRANDPTVQFQIAPPSIIWFELDQANFVRILNLASGTIWNQTRLNNVFPLLPDSETLYDSTKVKPAQKSPRKEWSHGH